ncbi:MAG: efflux RND transporter periplasmic adaptor subunit [Saprospiraceae bacterium]|nr:efflux RND transporter periplasmic adaptor subunit [Saprospiraceae bacterium]
MKNFILLFGSFILFWSCQTEHAAEHHETPRLQVATPLVIDTTVTRSYVCQIHASKHIELRALEQGYLQHISVDEGQTVTAGQPMFKILPNVYEAELMKTKAEAEMVRIEYQNTKMLADQKVVSANELALAKAKLDKALAEVKLAETHLGFTNIMAPFTGIMDKLHVREGSLLEEGELLTTLSDNSHMWVYFNVPEAEYLDYVTKGKTTNAQQVELQMANGQVFPHSGKVSTIEGEFNPETGNIQFRADFPNPEKILRHGETGNILMHLPARNALIIPQKATFEILDEKYVYIVNAENRLEQKRVEIAEELPHLYIIRSGVGPKDRILLEGLRRVKNGQEIEVNLQSPDQMLSELELDAE